MSRESLIRNDPRWTFISASKRARKLYIKMPHNVVEILISELEIGLLANPDPVLQADIQPLAQRIYQEKEESLKARSSAFIFSLSLGEAEDFLGVFSRVVHPRGRVYEFIEALRGGIQGDPSLDWMARVSPSGQKPAIPTEPVDPQEIWDLF